MRPGHALVASIRPSSLTGVRIAGTFRALLAQHFCASEETRTLKRSLSLEGDIRRGIEHVAPFDEDGFTVYGRADEMSLRLPQNLNDHLVSIVVYPF